MRICIHCRELIRKSGAYSYLCLDCERIVQKAQLEERQVYLDTYV